MIRTTLIVALAAASTSLAETPPPTGDAGYNDAGATILVNDELTEIRVTVDPADLAAMLADPFDNTYRLCTVRIINSRIDEIVNDVAIRPRGNTSRSATKKSWKLKFNEFVPGREVHGLEKLNLNGHQNDPSIIRGKLAWDLYNSFGVPSPRAAMARLIINDGSDVDGVFVNVEQIDDEFLDAWFGDDTGNLYQCAYKGERADLRYVPPGDAAAYAGLGTPTYELENDSGANQHQDLADFIWFIESADDATFASEIVERFSVDNFLRSLAIDAVNGHWDNLWYGANNFFLYANPDTGRFEYIPYDLDNTYGIDFFSTDWAARPPLSFGNGGFGWDFGSPHGGGAEPPLVRRILAIDAYRDQYLRYIRTLVGAVGDPDEPTVTDYADSTGDTFLSGTDPHFDLASVGVANNESDLLATVRLDGPVDVGGSTDQCRVVCFFDTRPGGSTSNPWGRQISTGVQADYFLGSWTDSGGGFILYEWTGGGWTQRHASFDTPGGLAQDLADKTDGVVRYTIPLTALGLTDTDSFDFDVVTTNDRSAGFEPGIDHLSNPSQATPDYDTASSAGTYPTHTLTPFVPSPTTFVDGPFTLPAREASIDDLRDQIQPHAFQGSFTPGNMDWGYTPTTFLDSFTQPAAYVSSSPWSWGLKPYIEARTAYLRSTVASPPALPQILINEVCAVNETVATDEAGQFEDFLELYNAGDTTVDLSGMWLSDDPGLPREWQIPPGTTLAPGAFLVVWCDNDPADGPLHATFGLSSGGETVVLSHNDAQGNVLLDTLTFGPLGPDRSFGRYADGEPATQEFCAVTPGATNDNDDTCFTESGPVPGIVINEWLASNDGVALDEFGDADDFVELYNTEDVPIDLGGMYLTDTLTNPTKWQIPDGVTIPAKGRLLFWCDEETAQGPLHADIKLSASGEEIGLFDRASNAFAPIDTLAFGPQTTDISEGRSPDGAACLAFFDPPSPGTPNAGASADVNNDGIVDNGDIGAFVSLFLAADPAADFNGDSVIDNGDIGAFVAAFLAGC